SGPAAAETYRLSLHDALPVLRGKVLMLDARHVFRKVTRKIFDFSPEQMKNLTSIVWLYRGQKERFAGLVQEYLNTARAEAQQAEDRKSTRLNSSHVKISYAVF